MSLWQLWQISFEAAVSVVSFLVNGLTPEIDTDKGDQTATAAAADLVFGLSSLSSVCWPIPKEKSKKTHVHHRRFKEFSSQIPFAIVQGIIAVADLSTI